jgi:hypothetical protein
MRYPAILKLCVTAGVPSGVSRASTRAFGRQNYFVPSGVHVQVRGRLVLDFFLGRSQLRNRQLGPDAATLSTNAQQYARTVHRKYEPNPPVAPCAQPPSPAWAPPRTRTCTPSPALGRGRTRTQPHSAHALPRPCVDAWPHTRVHRTQHAACTAHQTHTPRTHSNARALTHISHLTYIAHVNDHQGPARACSWPRLSRPLRLTSGHEP